jgi:hypothetical protein
MYYWEYIQIRVFSHVTIQNNMLKIIAPGLSNKSALSDAQQTFSIK